VIVGSARVTIDGQALDAQHSALTGVRGRAGVCREGVGDGHAPVLSRPIGTRQPLARPYFEASRGEFNLAGPP
jgi:hypothetical protein